MHVLPAAKYIGVTLQNSTSSFGRTLVVRLEDDLAEVSLQLGQKMRIFGYLQAADPGDADSAMSKVPGFGKTQVVSPHSPTPFSLACGTWVATCPIP